MVCRTCCAWGMRVLWGGNLRLWGVQFSSNPSTHNLQSAPPYISTASVAPLLYLCISYALCRNAVSRQSAQKGFHGMCSCVAAPCLLACPFTGIHALRDMKPNLLCFHVSDFASLLLPWTPYLFFTDPFFCSDVSF